MTGLSKIWKDRDLTFATKSRLVEASVFLVATYCCETWTLGKTQRDKLTYFEMWCWHRMLHVQCTAKRTNEYIMEQIKKYPMLEIMKLRRKLAYFGHVILGEGLEKAVMLEMGSGSISRGRPDGDG